MRPNSVPRMKICCIQDAAEARTAIQHGADALGLVSAMPSGPGVISEEKILEIAMAVPPPIATFLLTSEQEPEAIVAQQRRCRTNTIQLCNRLKTDDYARLRSALPGVSLVQVIHVLDDDCIAEAKEIAPYVDALLLDSGNPHLAVKELGGTGRTHNWEISRRIREAVETPIFLAGGLNADNAPIAIEQVGPFALDLCSGVRSSGRLDEKELKRFCAAVRPTGRKIENELR